jgi:hypothetical protein
MWVYVRFLTVSGAVFACTGVFALAMLGEVRHRGRELLVVLIRSVDDLQSHHGSRSSLIFKWDHRPGPAGAHQRRLLKTKTFWVNYQSY